MERVFLDDRRDVLAVPPTEQDMIPPSRGILRPDTREIARRVGTS